MADLRRRGLTERLPTTGGDPVAVARVVNALVDGHSGNTGTVTLGQSDTSTEIVSPIFRSSTVMLLVPLSEDAASIVWWIDSMSRRSVTIGHDAPAQDVSFAWIAVG